MGIEPQIKGQETMIYFLKEYLKQFFHMPSRIENPRRILVIRNDHIGDVVLSLPVLHAIRRAWPEAEIIYLTSEYTKAIVDRSPDIDRLIIQKKGETPEDTARKTGLKKIDVLLNFNSTSANAKLCRLVKAEIKVGYAYKPYNMVTFNRFVFTHRSKPPIHETAFMLDFLKVLGVEIKSQNLSAPMLLLMKHDAGEAQKRMTAVLTLGLLSPSQQAKKFMTGYLKKKKISGKNIIAIHSGDNKSADNWTFKRYLELAVRLAKHKGQKSHVVLVLGPAENMRIVEAEQKLAGYKNASIIPGDLSLEQLIAFINCTSVLVSGSTGPMHIAGVLGRKIVALFPSKKAESKEKWAPLGFDHEILEAENGKSVMESVSVEKVEKAVLEQIF